MKKLFPLAFAALSLAATASAQVQANLNDLILGFRATGGQGQNINLEVDLGSVSQFHGKPAGTTLTISGLSAADLTAIYGSGWSSRDDLWWGIVGTTGRFHTGPDSEAADTLWATRPQSTAGTQSLPYARASASAQANGASAIETLIAGAPASLSGLNATVNSAVSASVNATLAGSYTFQDTQVQAGTSFNFFNPLIDTAAKPMSGQTAALADLYEIQPGSGDATYLGTFSLSISGQLTFTTSASGSSGNGGLTILGAPSATSVKIGGSTTFTVSASTSSGTLTYQWYKNGTAISGATGATLTISNASSTDAANYTVTVSNGISSITSTAAALTVGSVPDQGRLINLSINTQIAANENMTMSFVVGGAGTSGTKPLLMRAVGPSLATFGVTSFLPDPAVDFYNGSTKITSDNDWAGDVSISSTAAAVGAFPFTSATSKDAAIYLSSVASGDHSIIISGGTGTGSVLGEVYDSTPSDQFGSSTPRLINVSVNKNVGDLSTVGFVIGGSTSLKVMIRAIGPGLAQFGLTDYIADPTMTLYDSKSNALATNNDWDATATPLSTQTSVGAFSITAGSKDAVLIQTLQPGAYTVQVKAATGASGRGLIEVYEMP